MNRRTLLKALALTGVGTPVFQRALGAMILQDGELTKESIANAEWVAGVELTDEEREELARGLRRQQQSRVRLSEFEISYSDSPAVFFRPLNADSMPNVVHNRAPELTEGNAAKPKTDEDLAFLPVRELAPLMKSRTIRSLDLTKIYLERLKKYNPLLNCVVTLTEEVALKHAKKADAEMDAGQYRGPLHGIPWGAKDLVAYPGYPTTWGAPQFNEQTFDNKATVASRLEQAGAVLVAKLTLGALAMGDQWFGGRTNSPWNPAMGSSGSSAGSASATVAGLVGFSIGTETLGSIVSPSRRCGATGLRPTFGRVSRHGCMPLSWTMDKIGPITRHIEDCALVFSAIQGTDGHDPTVVDQPFHWPPQRSLSGIKVGYTEGRTPVEERAEIAVLKSLGVELVKIELPQDYPSRDISGVLNAEAATVFDELTVSKNTDGINAWGRIFRQAKFMTAVDYLRAMRARRRLMEAMEEAISGVDLYVNGNDLVITNLTGHPTAVMPFGFSETEGVTMPGSVTFTGHLYDESTLLTVALAFQQADDTYLKRPPIDEFLAKMNEKPDEEAEKDDDGNV